MRNISCALTTDQVRRQTKGVTRRFGSWAHLQPGELLQPVVKGMGLKKGEKVELVGCPIQVVDVRFERLREGLTPLEVDREGFRDFSVWAFLQMFLGTHKGCTPDSLVTRIEFVYTVPLKTPDVWEAQLRWAGWRETARHAWQRPDGELFRGPYGAWCAMQGIDVQVAGVTR